MPTPCAYVDRWRVLIAGETGNRQRLGDAGNGAGQGIHFLAEETCRQMPTKKMSQCAALRQIQKFQKRKDTLIL